MVRSLANRKMPKPFAVLISVLLTLYFVPFTATGTAWAGEPTLTLEGCRGSAASFPDNGPFVCPDAEYTPGNLQKEWNELDLVPFRITSTSKAGDTFPFTTTLAADYKDKGNTGYDYISVPVVNTAKSDDSCQITDVGPLQYDQPSLGGADSTIRRTLTWTQDVGVTCVFDFYQRLALGASKYSGSNLQAYLGVDSGKKTVPLPVGAVLPQQISKTMTATQGSTFAWTVDKTATPSSVSFADTCVQSTEAKDKPVSIRIDWTRSAVQPSGDVTLTTNITATNPAHREITVNVTDKMYSGTTQTNELASNSASFDVPASSSHTFTFTETVSSTASTFNDVATATYTDKATGIAVPGNTTATATANVTSNGQTTGATAVITDVESISGSGFSYAVDSVTPNQGSFGSYVLGTQTTGNVSWNSGTIAPAGTGAASGSFTFAKTVHVAAGTVGSGTLADTATLTPDGLAAISDNASVSLTADAANPQLRITKTVDIAPDADATFTFTVWAKDSGGNKVGDPYTFTVTIPAGQTSATSAYQSVQPSQYGYLFEETAASGYTGVNGSIKALTKCEDYTALINNTRDLGKLKLHKVLLGDPIGAKTSFTVHVDCPGTTYDQDVVLNEANSWTNFTGDIPTGTVCTITEPTVPTGWRLVSIEPNVVAVGKGTPTTVSATITNERRVGKITINKKLVGAVAGASTDFTVQLDCDGTTYDKTVVLGAANNWTVTYDNIPTLIQCEVTEPADGIPAGWVLKSISPAGKFSVESGTTTTVDVTNERTTGLVEIKKVLEGDVAGASTTFVAHVDCDVNAYDQDVTLSSGNGWSVTLTIPTGVKCTVTETSIPAGWVLKSINPAGEFTVGGTKVTVTITNERTTGLVEIKKVLEGDVAGASTTFVAHVDCDVDAYDQDVTLSSVNGWSVTLTIPTGVKCTVTEKSIPAGWVLKSISPAGEFTVGGTKVTVTITNSRVVTGVAIKKVLDGPVAGAGTEFVARLDCDGTSYDQDVVLNSGNSWLKTVSVPSGLTCKVTEKSIPAGWSLKSINPAGEFVVGDQTVEVTITNSRNLGELTITKVLSGDVAGADTSFVAHVDCDVNAYDQDVTLDGANNWSETLTIPTGVKCTVTETSIPAGWTLKSINPAGEFTVGDTEVTVTITNERTTGLVEIKKVLSGDVAGASTTFGAHVDCDIDAYDQDVTLSSGNGWKVTLTIPTGVKCTVTETSIPAGWSLKSIDPAGEFTVGDTKVSVTITNERETGLVEIKKVISGDVAGASTTFEAHVDCDVNDYDQHVTLEEANGWSVTLTIPTGVKCTVTETSIPAGWSLKSIDPAGEFTVGETKVTVTITNERELGVITVAKELVGSAETLNTDFVFDVDCPGTDYDQTVNVSVTEGAEASSTTEPIPTGLTCTVTEQDHPHWSLTKVVPEDGAVAVGGTVTFTNERKPANLVITKAVSPVAGNGVIVHFGDTLTYTLTVTAGGELDQPSVKVTDYVPGFDPARPKSGKTTYVAGSAKCVGDGDCTVTEPGADGLITWELGDMAAGTSRQVTFKVTIDRPAAAADGSIPAVDILNAGAVESARTPRTPSNEVVTPVAAVLGEKVPAAPLPRTGASVPLGPLAGMGLLLFGLGALLMGAARRRGEHRKS